MASVQIFAFRKPVDKIIFMLERAAKKGKEECVLAENRLRRLSRWQFSLHDSHEK